MAKISAIMMLLPVVFVIHEYEEIIMFRRWIDRNREELRKRFPKIESFFTRRGHLDYSTATFAVGTFHEFILISIVSCWCIDWIFCSPLDAYCTMDCVSKICASYHH